MEHQSHVGQALGLRRAPSPPLALFLLLPITAFAASLTVLPPSVNLDGHYCFSILSLLCQYCLTAGSGAQVGWMTHEHEIALSPLPPPQKRVLRLCFFLVCVR